MKYFRWTPEMIANMSWDYYNMALASIPSSEPEEEKLEEVHAMDMK